jgi:hypothetical protein
MAEHTALHDIEKPADMEQVELKKEFIYETDPRVTAFSPEEQKRIYRRVDIRLVATLGCMYMISLLDRTNLGAASVAGYEEHHAFCIRNKWPSNQLE